MRNNSNFFSFLFTGILLILVLFSKTDINANDLSYQENIKNTSLTASTHSIKFTKTITSQNEINKLALKTINVEQKPIKKEFIDDPILTAEIAFSKHIESGKELFSHNNDKQWSIASITKLVTAIVALEKIGADKIITISESAINTEGIAGNFRKDEKYYLKDLVNIMLVVSSNDAAIAMSEFYGQKNFIKEMNMKAQEIGMTQTKFIDCTGLSFLNQSTIKDLIKLAEYILKEKPEIFNFAKHEELSVIELENNLVKFFKNINYFAGQIDFLGGKTGFIESSGENLLSVFTYEENDILIIVLGSDDRYSDTENILKWIKKSYKF
ncbi:serine hydrolase [Patescibacteria group bacterium]|nr:serine hydrolase [Patescibacteria group bacterium]